VLTNKSWLLVLMKVDMQVQHRVRFALWVMAGADLL
jgi:hypothetical protein